MRRLPEKGGVKVVEMGGQQSPCPSSDVVATGRPCRSGTQLSHQSTNIIAIKFVFLVDLF